MAIHKKAIHDNNKTHKCQKCFYATAYKQALKRHTKALHSNKGEEVAKVPSTEELPTTNPTAEGQTEEEEEEANQSFYSAASDELPLM